MKQTSVAPPPPLVVVDRSMAASDARIDAALAGEAAKKIGHVAPGEILRSKSGRILSPVPKFNPGGGGARRSVSEIRKWLVKEAQLEGGSEADANVWVRDLVRGMDPKNIAPADADLLNDILFGSPRGPGPEHRVAPIAPTVVTTMPEVDIKAEAQRKVQAKKLREGALSHLAQAEEDLNRDRQSNTARQARMAAGSIKDAQQRALIAGTMNNIADLVEAGEAGHLATIGTRAQVEALDLVARQSVYAWERDTKQPYHGDREIIPELKHVPHAKLPAGEWSVKERARLERMGFKTDQDLQAALREYLPLRGDRPREDPIKAAERALVGTKPGIDFFPTPPPLAQRMVQLAGIQPGERVLEPSAGKGDIADAIRAAGGKVDAVEMSETLRKVLAAKGHTLVGADFEAFDSHDQYDAIVMNPPWSGGADVRHVMRAYGMVKPGGRLVALMSMHPSFAQDKASQAFRAWMEHMGATAEKIQASDFASQWMTGGIPSWLVHVDKPMTKALFLRHAA